MSSGVPSWDRSAMRRAHGPQPTGARHSRHAYSEGVPDDGHRIVRGSSSAELVMPISDATTRSRATKQVRGLTLSHPGGAWRAGGKNVSGLDTRRHRGPNRYPGPALAAAREAARTRNPPAEGPSAPEPEPDAGAVPDARGHRRRGPLLRPRERRHRREEGARRGVRHGDLRDRGEAPRGRGGDRARPRRGGARRGEGGRG